MVSIFDNPFYLIPCMPEKFFCDRERDIRALAANIRKGDNTLLYAAPSTGKTALLYHLLRRPEIRESYHTLYVSLRGTKNQYDFLCALRGALWLKDMFSTYPEDVARSVDGLETGLNDMMGGASDEDLRYAIEEAVEKALFLLDANGPGVVVFDDFHLIERYERSMAALLRSHIQFLGNTHFIYASGDLPTVWKMFDSPKEPFYHSASTYTPNAISADDYLAFCQRCMALGGKTINRESVERVCSFFHGNMMHMQEVMARAYERPEQDVTSEVIDRAIGDTLALHGNIYRIFLASLKNDDLRNMVIMLGREWEVRHDDLVEKARQYGVSEDADVFGLWKELSFRAVPVALRRGDIYYLADGMLRFWIFWGFFAIYY